jgi:hypothetical protein
LQTTVLHNWSASENDLELMMPHTKKPQMSASANALLKEISVAVRECRENIADKSLLSQTYPLRQLLLTEIANLRDEDAVSRLWRQHWRTYPELALCARTDDPRFKQEVLELRDDLRKVWRGPELDSSNLILDRWLNWRPSSGFLNLSFALRGLRAPGGRMRGSQRDDHRLASYLSESKADHVVGYMPFRCSIRERTLVPRYDNLRSNLIQGVFEHWRHFRFCTNSECAAPYFIAKRSDQVVCGDRDCKAQMRQSYVLNWWREKRAKEKQAKGVETKLGKGRLKHGPRKAR